MSSLRRYNAWWKSCATRRRRYKVRESVYGRRSRLSTLSLILRRSFRSSAKQRARCSRLHLRHLSVPLSYGISEYLFMRYDVSVPLSPVADAFARLDELLRPNPGLTMADGLIDRSAKLGFGRVSLLFLSPARRFSSALVLADLRPSRFRFVKPPGNDRRDRDGGIFAGLGISRGNRRAIDSLLAASFSLVNHAACSKKEQLRSIIPRFPFYGALMTRWSAAE